MAINTGIRYLNAYRVSGSQVRGGVIAGTDVDVSGRNLTLDNDQISGDKISGGTIGGVTLDGSTLNSTHTLNGTLDVSGGTFTLANDQISGDKVSGGTIGGSVEIEAADGTVSIPGIRFASDSNVGIFRPSGNNMSLITTGVERVKIDENGQVGINETNPQEYLHVNGKVRSSDNYTFQNSSPGEVARINWIGQNDASQNVVYAQQFGSGEVSTDGSEEGRLLWRLVNGGGTVDPIDARTNNTSMYGGLLYVDRVNGRVGINTDSPNKKLEVVEPNTTQVQLTTTDTNASCDLIFSDGAEQGRIRYDHSNDLLSFWANDSASLYVNSTGRVGIGVSNPQDTLDVNGGIQSGNLTLDDFGDLIITDNSSNEVLRLFADGENGRLRCNGNIRLQADQDNNGDGVITATVGGTNFFTCENDGDFVFSRNVKLDSSANVLFGGDYDIQIRANNSQTNNGRKLRLQADGSSDEIRLEVATTLHWTLNSDGTLYSADGQTTPANDGLQGIAIRGGDPTFQCARNNARIGSWGRNGNNGEVFAFHKDGTKVGGIEVDGSSTTYATSSDRRLKHNDRQISDAVNRVKETNWVAFDWVRTGLYGEGIVAQDEADRWPTAVRPPQDDADDTESFWRTDYSKMVPALGAALSDALRRIEALETKVNG